MAGTVVKRPVFATVLILSLTVIGVFSFTRLGVDRFPKIDFPTVTVTTLQPGAAPEQIETEITDKIEEAVNTISGIDDLRSVSSEGVSQVIVSFLLDKNTDVAAQEVRDKVNGVLPRLPKTIQQPRVDKMDPDAAPVLSLALSATRPVRDITEYADKVLRRQFESLNGVGQVVLSGGRSRQINIRLDAARLRAYNLTVTDVSRALQGQNIEIPGPHRSGAQSITLPDPGRVQRWRIRRHRRPREDDIQCASRRARIEDGEAEPNAGERRRRRDRAAPGPAAIGHQHGRSRGRRQGTARGPEVRSARRVHGARRAGHFRLHRGRDSQRRRAPDRRLHSCGARRADLPDERARKRSSPRLRSRLIIAPRAALVHGIHSSTDDDARADPLGRHRHRRCDRGPGEHLSLHRGKARRSDSRGHPATQEIGLAVPRRRFSLVAIFVPVAFMGGIVGRFRRASV